MYAMFLWTTVLQLERYTPVFSITSFSTPVSNIHTQIYIYIYTHKHTLSLFLSLITFTLWLSDPIRAQSMLS